MKISSLNHGTSLDPPPSLTPRILAFPSPTIHLIATITQLSPTPPLRLRLAHGGRRRTRQDLAEQIIDILPRRPNILPLPRVSQTALLKPNALLPIRARDMQVSRNDDLRIELGMPVHRQRRSAPEAEPGHARDKHKVLSQGPMIHKHSFQPRIPLSRLLDLILELLDERVAPLVPRRVRVRMEQELVGGDGIAFLSPLERAPPRHLLRPEAVIVEREDRAHEHPVPDHELVLGRQHAVFARDLHAPSVLRLASQMGARARAHSVQLVVPGTPPDLFKIAFRDGESEREVVGRLADVAAQDDSILGVRRDFLECLSIVLVAEVEISDGVEFHRDAWS